MTATDNPPRTAPLEILTDEELSLLTEEGVVVSPYLATLAAADLDSARRTAFRGLLARGIVEPPRTSSAAVDGAVELLVRHDVLSALTLRRSAPAVVAVARATSLSQDFWYAHVVEEITLVEEVGTDGLHRFALAHTADLPELLVDAALCPDAVDGPGVGFTVAEGQDAPLPAALVDRLGTGYVRADVVLLGSGRDEGSRPVLTGLFTGPEGSWSIVADPAATTLTARPETVADVRDRLHSLAHLVAP
jgi:hypothetical protein